MKLGIVVVIATALILSCLLCFLRKIGIPPCDETGEADVPVMRVLNFPTIEGAKVQDAQEADRIAFPAYIQRTKNIQGSDLPGDFRVITLGYNVPDFARVGDRVWEVRVKNIDNGNLRGVIWINSATAQTRLITGAWEDSVQHPARE